MVWFWRESRESARLGSMVVRGRTAGGVGSRSGVGRGGCLVLIDARLSGVGYVDGVWGG